MARTDSATQEPETLEPGDRATAQAVPAPVPTAPAASQAASQRQRFDPKHRLHRDEMARIFAEGGSVLHRGEMHTSFDTLPEDYEHGEAFTLDSPHHPQNKKAREQANRLRDIQEGRIAPGEDVDSAEVKAEKEAKRKGQ